MIWRKSTFSAANGGCVEIGWRRSSFSAPNNDCVEVALTVTAVAVRDSKNVDGPVLDFAPSRWRAFLATAC
jgi:hypothetical protein